MRAYERYWELLKRDKRIVIKIEGDHMTPAKAEVAYRKFARGIQKEKYQVGMKIRTGYISVLSMQTRRYLSPRTFIVIFPGSLPL